LQKTFDGRSQSFQHPLSICPNIQERGLSGSALPQVNDQPDDENQRTDHYAANLTRPEPDWIAHAYHICKSKEQGD
jgi:hypothetical protein